MQIIQHQELGSAQASITFSSIPQTYTDLVLVTSLRDTTASTGWENAFVYPNGSSADMTSRFLYGWGSGNVGTAMNTPAVLYHQTARGGNTANTFSSSVTYITNYGSSAPKNFSCETTVERNDIAGINAITAGLWNSTSPITSLVITAAAGSFAQYSSATLYGITKGSDGTTTVS